MERVLADLYGPRTLVADGVVPGEALSSTTRYRIGSVGLPPPPRWLTTYAVDVVATRRRDVAGRARPRRRPDRDRLRAARPSGDAAGRVARAARTGVASLVGCRRRAASRPRRQHGRRQPAHRAASAAASTTPATSRTRSSPGSSGSRSIERPDVVVRQGRLWLRTLGGLDPIDVVYRRVDDDETDPIELAAPAASGVPGVLSAVAGGGVVLANAHGCGLLEDPTLARYWPAAAEALTGTSLRLPQLGDAARTAQLRTFPAFRAGELGEAAVVLRLHAVAGPDGVTVVPGGNGRVLAPGDDPRQPSARNVKDVWVLDRSTVAPGRRHAAAAGRPRRLGPDARRRRAVLDGPGRRARRGDRQDVARRRRSSPPGPAARHDRRRPVVVAGRRGAASPSACVDAGDGADRRRGPALELDAATVGATRQLGARLRSFVAEAASVGEFLPERHVPRADRRRRRSSSRSPTGRAPVDAIDDVLAVARRVRRDVERVDGPGPAWRFGDIGVRARTGARRARPHRLARGRAATLAA